MMRIRLLPPMSISKPPLALSEERPLGPALLALERRARQQGTGLTASRLEGCWLLEEIWPRDGLRSARIPAAVLRSLAASLTITALPPADGVPAEGGVGELQLRNSVRIAALELRFSGPGWLRGRRPLLSFQFDRLQLLIGDRVLLERQLPLAPPQKQPFFALIAMASGGEWLAARGRSGGLARWRRAPH